jgi:type II secretory pathway component PulF
MTWMIRDFLFWTFFWMLPMIVTVALCYFFLSLPARRNERARLFLELLETGLQQGQSPERTIVSASETRDRSLGVHFHLLAAHVEEGARLHMALERAPNLLPPAAAAAVKIGSSEGTLERMLPAARGMLEDVNSRMQGALNHVVLFVLVIVPTALFLMPMLSQFIWPKLQQTLMDMEVTPPAFTSAVFANIGWITLIESVVLLSLLLLGFFYVGGPRLLRARTKSWAHGRIVFYCGCHGGEIESTAISPVPWQYCWIPACVRNGPWNWPPKRARTASCNAAP